MKNEFQIVEFELTYRCPLNCKHCYNGYEYKKYKKLKELSTKEIEKIIRQIKELGIKEIHLGGGEPLYRDDIIKIIELCKKNSLLTVLETSAYLFNLKIIEKMKNVNIDKVRISLDGWHYHSHDKFRGKNGTFERVIWSINMLQERNIPIEITSVVTKYNYRNIIDIINLVRNLGVKFYRARLFLPYGRGQLNSKELLISSQQAKEVYDVLVRESRKPLPKINPKDFLRQPFSENLNKFYITPYGKIKPYGFLSISYGDLRKEKLKDLLYKMNEIAPNIIKESEQVNNYINSIIMEII